MWRAESERVGGAGVVRYRLFRDADRLRYSEVVALWRYDTGFREHFNVLLGDAPFEEFRWETPPVSTATVDRPFEFVLLDSPGLDRPADPSAFAAHLTSGDGEPSVVAFANLGGDAVLVVPSRRGPLDAYGHLAVFVRRAPAAQRDLLWETVGRSVEGRLGERPLWLSTAGMGIPWLHVRLDSRPKYYGFRAYRDVHQQA